MRRKKKTFWRPAAAGFGVMYLAITGLATWLVKEQFADDYGQRFREGAVTILAKKASEKEFSMEEVRDGWDEAQRKDFYQALANEELWRVDSDRLLISVAFYDEDGKLLAKSRDQVGGSSVWESSTVIREYASFALDDFLSQEEKIQLARYNSKRVQTWDLTQPAPLRFSMRVSPNGRELWAIYVQELMWTEEGEWDGDWYTDPVTGSRHIQDSGVTVDYATGQEMGEGKTFYETDSEIVWQWLNPAVPDAERTEGVISSETNLGLPYMDVYGGGSYEKWKKWSESPYLHDIPETGEFVWESGLEEPPFIIDSDGLYYRGRYQLKVGMVDAPSAYMEIRMEGRPWLAAMDYMKYVYLAGAALTLVCMAGIVRSFSRTYDRQAALEENRRDCINAMAHELKTPLGVIRNFAENLLEHNMEEKRDYYLAQIIRQTEEMDQMAAEMIELSKLDSEELVLGNEPVSFSELIREQMARLEPKLQEMRLAVEYQEEGSFVVNGDRNYLAKAVWNLLSNAVEYNQPDGGIWIRIGTGQCVIENTGLPLKEDQLLHAFDLFYSGAKEAGGGNRHTGMGLFLARKILRLHGLDAGLENGDGRIRAIIK